VAAPEHDQLGSLRIPLRNPGISELCPQWPPVLVEFWRPGVRPLVRAGSRIAMPRHIVAQGMVKRRIMAK
jgi:hypothetical protein